MKFKEITHMRLPYAFKIVAYKNIDIKSREELHIHLKNRNRMMKKWLKKKIDAYKKHRY